MGEINIRNEPCDCPQGQCAEMLDRDELCINRLRGDVRTMDCPRCRAATWHHDGKCLRCPKVYVPGMDAYIDDAGQ